MVESIIRAPTRTKTKSFNGPQMDFQFPSTESLPSSTLDEYHMNNHYLLNDTVTKAVPLHQEEDVASQILSDYTNSGISSNGYYSFANISDNTTASKTLGNKIIMHTDNVSKNRQYPATLAPAKTSSPLLNTKDVSSSTQNQSDSINEVVKTMWQDIAKEEGITHALTKSISNMDAISFRRPPSSQSSFPVSHNSSQKITPSGNLHRVPTMTRIKSMQSSPSLKSFPSVYNTAIKRNISVKKSNSLKRSKAIYCKGGLLQYFTLLGRRFKRQVKRFRSVIRKKLFGYHSKRTAPNTSATDVVKPKRHSKKKTQQSLDHPASTTLHMKRTQNYTSNLRRSMSYKKLEPVLNKKLIKTPAKLDDMGKTNTSATSLRRTPSSIRRAASVFNSSVTSGSSPLLRSVTDSPAKIQSRSSSTRSGFQLPRSTGSQSLASLVRQPSIVVNNKVIPLSMTHHPADDPDSIARPGYQTIVEEEEEEDDGSQDDYVVNTANMQKLSSARSENSSLAEAYADAIDYDRNDMYMPLERQQEREEEDLSSLNSDETKKPELDREQVASSFNIYLKNVIAQRIMLRLQLAKLNEQTPAKLQYLEMITNVVTDYDQDTALTSDTTETESEEEEEEEEEEDNVPGLWHNTAEQFAHAIRSNLSLLHPGNSTSSTLSSPIGPVQRSLTLPIGIKV